MIRLLVWSLIAILCCCTWFLFGIVCFIFIFIDGEEDNIHVLLDDGVHEDPTSENIIAAYRRIVAESVDGDCVYCHYSGHGGKVRYVLLCVDTSVSSINAVIFFQISNQIKQFQIFLEMTMEMRLTDMMKPLYHLIFRKLDRSGTMIF